MFILPCILFTENFRKKTDILWILGFLHNDKAIILCLTGQLYCDYVIWMKKNVIQPNCFYHFFQTKNLWPLYLKVGSINISMKKQIPVKSPLWKNIFHNFFLSLLFPISCGVSKLIINYKLKFIGKTTKK